MNTPSKPPPFQNATRIMQSPTLPRVNNCTTCGKRCELGGTTCERCFTIEQGLEEYAKTINGRILLKKAIEKAERDLEQAAKRVIR